jgi:hypothetical protein
MVESASRPRSNLEVSARKPFGLSLSMKLYISAAVTLQLSRFILATMMQQRINFLMIPLEICAYLDTALWPCLVAPYNRAIRSHRTVYMLDLRVKELLNGDIACADLAPCSHSNTIAYDLHERHCLNALIGDILLRTQFPLRGSR